MPSYVNDQRDRGKRQDNISEFFKNNPKMKGRKLAAKKIRREILANMQDAPTLKGKKIDGDFRAHGDAIGDHGLKLQHTFEIDPETGREARVILMNEHNYKICRKRLEERNTTVTMW